MQIYFVLCSVCSTFASDLCPLRAYARISYGVNLTGVRQLDRKVMEGLFEIPVSSLMGLRCLQPIGNKIFSAGAANGLRKTRYALMANTPHDIEEEKWSSWYVLTTSNPKHLENLIAQANALKPGQYDSYCPYTRLPEESGRTDADSQFSLRAALRRYDFVRIPKTTSELQFMAAVSEWNRSSVNSILFLRNGDRTNAKVSNGQLNRMRACCDAVLIKPENLSLRDLKKGDEISLAGTPFDAEGDEHRKCIIQSVTRKKGGLVELRVEMPLFNVRFSNLTITLEDGGASKKASDLVYDAQQKLLAIFRRKTNNKETDATRRQDEKTLQDIFDNRAIALPEGAMSRHYLALMLICARMMNDAKALQQYTGLVNAALGDLSRLRESKAATDSRAWLHIAMFIATGKPHYRNLAKAYLKNYAPKSTYLQQFVKQSCKTAGERWIGLRKNRHPQA